MHEQMKRLYEAASKLKGISGPSELARALNESPQTINNWESRGVSKGGALSAQELIGCSATWLRTGKGDMLIQAYTYDTPLPNGLTLDDLGDPARLRTYRTLPIVGEVQGGDDGYLLELQYPVGHGEGAVEWPTRDPQAYALRVRGDSMHPRYRAGEFVIVEPSIEPQPGDDVVTSCKDGRKMLKQLNWIRDGEVQFLSINNHYAPITMLLSEIDSIQLASGRAPRSAMVK